LITNSHEARPEALATRGDRCIEPHPLVLEVACIRMQQT
jgi:hypothetical protein